MAFTVQEFRDLIQILEQHPEWRAELRRLVLTEELLTLPQIVRELVEAQHRTEQRVEQLIQQVERLGEVQLRMGTDVERLKGNDLERRYRERGHAYFSRLVRRAHVLSGDELIALLDVAVAGGQLSEEEADEILQADVVVRGRRRDDGAEVYLVAEVSWGVGISDVQRASQRATLLSRTGTPTLPVVAGYWVIPEAQEPARALRVWQVTDGSVIPPEAGQGSPSR
jgi:hypothetical protein